MTYLTNDSTDPHYNMAFDEFCLEHMPVEEPVFYLWQNRPSVIIGLNQNAYGEVNLKYLSEHGITLARRVTGGGAVYHDLQNLNYTIVGRSADLERDYNGYMTYVIDALRSLGVKAELSGRNDIMVDGRKVSGYAKRVWKDRLMVHGTLMYDVDIDTLTAALDVPGSKMRASGIASVHSRVANLKEYLPQMTSVKDLQEALQKILAGDDGEVTLTEKDLSEIRSLSETKFSTEEWVIGHSPETRFRHTKKCVCGTVELSMTVTRGVLVEMAFAGDFLGNLPAEKLADILKGCRYDRENILKRLDGAQVGLYLDGADEGELADLMLDSEYQI